MLANAVIIGVETDYAAGGPHLMDFVVKKGFNRLSRPRSKARNEGLGRLPFSHALSQLFCGLADLSTRPLFALKVTSSRLKWRRGSS